MLTQRKALVFVTLVLLSFSLLRVRWTGGVTSVLRSTVDTLQIPARLAANTIKVDPVVDRPEMSQIKLADQLAAARRENDNLWQENQRLREQIDSFNAIKLVRPIESILMVESQVSHFNQDPVNPTMSLMRGTLHGLKPEDAVAFKSNLIGFVTDQIGPVSATVTLVTKPGFSVEVHIMPPPGVQAGDGWPFRTRVISDGKGKFYCDLDKQITKELRPGDYVRVSDTIRESANGFLLGLIEEIRTGVGERPLLEDRVIIKPRAPIGPQRMVTVLTELND